jgi:hypothetical protein
MPTLNLSFAEQKRRLPPVPREALARAQALAQDHGRTFGLLDAFLDRGRSLERPEE